jgi:hypothetical protein
MAKMGRDGKRPGIPQAYMSPALGPGSRFFIGVLESGTPAQGDGIDEELAPPEPPPFAFQHFTLKQPFAMASDGYASEDKVLVCPSSEHRRLQHRKLAA